MTAALDIDQGFARLFGAHRTTNPDRIGNPVDEAYTYAYHLLKTPSFQAIALLRRAHAHLTDNEPVPTCERIHVSSVLADGRRGAPHRRAVKDTLSLDNIEHRHVARAVFAGETVQVTRPNGTVVTLQVPGDRFETAVQMLAALVR